MRENTRLQRGWGEAQGIRACEGGEGTSDANLSRLALVGCSMKRASTFQEEMREDRGVGRRDPSPTHPW